MLQYVNKSEAALKKNVCLPSPNRPNYGGADSKYFIGPLKAIFVLKNIS